MIGLHKCILKGVVISNKMMKTVVVRVDKNVRHKKYKKIVTRSTKYFVHDEKSECNVGETIYFREVAPISKRKNWILYSKDVEKGS